MIWTTTKYTCTHTFDPCYGHRIIRPGDEIVVQTQPESHGTSQRVIQSNEGKAPGWGWPISASDLRNHFRAVAS